MVYWLNKPGRTNSLYRGTESGSLPSPAGPFHQMLISADCIILVFSFCFLFLFFYLLPYPLSFKLVIKKKKCCQSDCHVLEGKNFFPLVIFFFKFAPYLWCSASSQSRASLWISLCGSYLGFGGICGWEWGRLYPSSGLANPQPFLIHTLLSPSFPILTPAKCLPCLPSLFLSLSESPASFPGCILSCYFILLVNPFLRFVIIFYVFIVPIKRVFSAVQSSLGDLISFVFSFLYCLLNYPFISYHKDTSEHLSLIFCSLWSYEHSVSYLLCLDVQNPCVLSGWLSCMHVRVSVSVHVCARVHPHSHGHYFFSLVRLLNSQPAFAAAFLAWVYATWLE